MKLIDKSCSERIRVFFKWNCTAAEMAFILWIELCINAFVFCFDYRRWDACDFWLPKRHHRLGRSHWIDLQCFLDRADSHRQQQQCRPGDLPLPLQHLLNWKYQCDIHRHRWIREYGYMLNRCNCSWWVNFDGDIAVPDSKSSIFTYPIQICEEMACV